MNATTYVLALCNGQGYPLAVAATIGGNIEAAREAKGLTQSQLARAIGKPPSWVSDRERDRYKTLDSDTLLLLAAGIQCSVETLVAGVHEKYDSIRDAFVVSSPLPSASITTTTGRESAHVVVATDAAARLRAERQRDAAIAALKRAGELAAKLVTAVESGIARQDLAASAGGAKRRGARRTNRG